MDPILETIVFGVLWFFVGSGLSVVIYMIFVALAAAIGVTKNSMGGASLVVLFGWLAAVAWQMFVIVQVILHIVTLVQLLTA